MYTCGTADVNRSLIWTKFCNFHIGNVQLYGFYSIFSNSVNVHFNSTNWNVPFSYYILWPTFDVILLLVPHGLPNMDIAPYIVLSHLPSSATLLWKFMAHLFSIPSRHLKTGWWYVILILTWFQLHTTPVVCKCLSKNPAPPPPTGFHLSISGFELQYHLKSSVFNSQKFHVFDINLTPSQKHKVLSIQPCPSPPRQSYRWYCVCIEDGKLLLYSTFCICHLVRAGKSIIPKNGFT